ncbi:fumarate reductase cytochrome b subunit [Nitratifractor sp.]
MSDLIEGYLGKRVDGTKSRVPAALDRWQSITGLILGLFIIGHMLFTSSILLGKDAMYAETKLFEGSLFLDEPEPMLVGFAATVIFVIFVIHAGLAMRKFPYRWREYKLLKTHSAHMGHTDTMLWMVQAATGFGMFFLGSVHLWTMMSTPEKIGPYASSDRIYTDNMGFLYGLLIALVILHAMVGLYRLSVKWGITVRRNPRADRIRNKKIMWGAILFFSLLAYSALGTYWRIGKEHRQNYGERYLPQSTNPLNSSGGGE